MDGWARGNTKNDWTNCVGAGDPRWNDESVAEYLPSHAKIGTVRLILNTVGPETGFVEPRLPKTRIALQLDGARSDRDSKLENRKRFA